MIKKYKVLPLNLQFFAEEGGEGKGRGPQGEPNPDQKDDVEESIQLTEEELQKKIESEADRKLASALEKKQKEWEKEYNERLEQEKKEAERLAKLSAKERQEEELTKREKQLEKRLKELERRELKSDAVADLNEKGLPTEFADFLLGENAEETLENINNLKKVFDEAVNSALKEKLKQEVPNAGNETKEHDPFSAKLSKYK